MEILANLSLPLLLLRRVNEILTFKEKFRNNLIHLHYGKRAFSGKHSNRDDDSLFG